MLLKVFYKEIHHKRSIFIVLLVFVGFDFVEPQSAGNDTEKYTASELAANHQHATELCTSVGGRLPVIKDRNSIINFKQWLLSYVGEDEGCPLLRLNYSMFFTFALVETCFSQS